MRTYWYLIRSEIDFRKAVSPELGLIPQGDAQNPVTFEKFVDFLEPFSRIGDDSANQRLWLESCG